jgi:DNA-binding response OmpR family regulator
MGAKILLIEDDASAIELLMARLRAGGYEVDVAMDALAGVKAVRQNQPDLILLDLKIPAGGGIGVLEALQKSFLLKIIPIIVLTGTTDSSMKKKLLEFGIKTYLQKPYQSDDLMRAIAASLPSRNP